MTEKKDNKEEKNGLEWTITIISGIIVVFTLGFLVYQMIYEEQTPPDIVVVLGGVSQKDGAFAIPIKATNKGTETAENVLIEIILKDGVIEEKSEINFAYLPRKSSVNGWVIFSKKPESKNLQTRVIGYSIP